MTKEVKEEKGPLPVTELNGKQLRFYCDEGCLDFESTATVAPLEGMIGQERAVQAVEFGLRTKNPGYNIFVSGMVGTGKFTYVKQAVRKWAKRQPVSQDWCYVNNFDDPSQPLAISLPAGTGFEFRQEMEELLENLQNGVPKAFSSDDYEKEKAVLMKEFQLKRSEVLQEFGEKAEEFSVSPKWSTTGFMAVPLVDGNPVSPEDFENLPQEKKDEIERNMQAVHDLAMAVVRQVQHLERDVKEKIHELDSRVGMFIVGHLIDELQEKYQGNEAVSKYLEDVRKSVVKGINDFKQPSSGEEEEGRWRYSGRRRRKLCRKNIRLTCW